MFKISLILITLGFSVMWVTSYSHYTSIGIDRDKVIVIEKGNTNQIEHSYYRIRWPGNGSIWIGGGSSSRALSSAKPFEAFDLAATFLYSDPERPTIQSNFNKIGFWLIKHSKPSKQVWLGVPAWLPVLFFGLTIFLLRNNNLKRYRR